MYLSKIMFLCVFLFFFFFFTNVLLNRVKGDSEKQMLRHCISSENNEVYYTK